eukprot:2961080-Rhodomonas_salina.1
MGRLVAGSMRVVWRAGRGSEAGPGEQAEVRAGPAGARVELAAAALRPRVHRLLPRQHPLGASPPSPSASASARAADRGVLGAGAPPHARDHAGPARGVPARGRLPLLPPPCALSPLQVPHSRALSPSPLSLSSLLLRLPLSFLLFECLPLCDFPFVCVWASVSVYLCLCL